MANSKHFQDIKQGTRQRLQYIEVMAYYTGVVSRSDLSRTFGISDAAATKTLKQYNDLVPNNLVYQHSDFGFAPTAQFEAIFADLSPQTVLPMIAGNLATTAQTMEESPVYGIQVDSLPQPVRLPDKSIVAQIIRAIKHRQKAEIIYSSMTDSENNETRIIEPHSLVNSGLRWHVRAYNERSYDFRDFVLSRISQATRLKIPAESSAIYDDDWVETTRLKLAPHPGLGATQQQGLLLDYGATAGVIELEVRRALTGYVLQKLSVDTTEQHSMNPNAYQLILLNREEVAAFASWSFL
ncbi:MAG: WYL domain-containing protein [Gammaproteobacteria bacterium]|nr:WYL domain-containing protein [Gammaproteobacteria bacterium]